MCDIRPLLCCTIAMIKTLDRLRVLKGAIGTKGESQQKQGRGIQVRLFPTRDSNMEKKIGCQLGLTSFPFYFVQNCPLLRYNDR